MRTNTRLDWHARVEKAIGEIMRLLNESVDLDRLSREVCSSPYHFHRMFRQLTGETVQGCVRRLRLERAIDLLRSTGRSVTDIALDSGYETLESFVKAFRAAYGFNPSDARALRAWEGVLYSPVGLHYTERYRSQWFYIGSKGDGTMETKIVSFPRKRVVGVENVGDYWGLPKAWDTFHRVLVDNRLEPAGKEWICAFPDHDDRIPMAEKRSYPAMVVDDDFVNTYGLSELTIPEGLYAVTVHFGASEGIGPAWERWMSEWLPESGWEVDVSRPNYEWYQNRCDQPELLLTFLCSPVTRKR
jgi:AraC family transcriptional regulator